MIQNQINKQIKLWKDSQDKTLKQIVQNNSKMNWKQISILLQEKYGIVGRNGKQCRQRYHNHLKNGISKEKWTKQQQQKLIDIHSSIGNKWTIIVKYLPGRTQNYIKNMLYSKVRRIGRKINKFIRQYFSKQYKSLDIPYFYRIVEIAERIYKIPQNMRTDQQRNAIDVKNQLISFSNFDEQLQLPKQHEKMAELIRNIYSYKKYCQKYRTSAKSKKFVCKTIKNLQLQHQQKLIKYQEIEEISHLQNLGKFNQFQNNFISQNVEENLIINPEKYIYNQFEQNYEDNTLKSEKYYLYNALQQYKTSDQFDIKNTRTEENEEWQRYIFLN